MLVDVKHGQGVASSIDIEEELQLNFDEDDREIPKIKRTYASPDFHRILREESIWPRCRHLSGRSIASGEICICDFLWGLLEPCRVLKVTARPTTVPSVLIALVTRKFPVGSFVITAKADWPLYQQEGGVRSLTVNGTCSSAAARRGLVGRNHHLSGRACFLGRSGRCRCRTC